MASKISIQNIIDSALRGIAKAQKKISEVRTEPLTCRNNGYKQLNEEPYEL